MSNAERMADAEAARAAWERWVGPVITEMREDCLTKLATIAAKPMTADNRAGMEKIALAIKVYEEVKKQIDVVVADGGVARAGQKRAEQIAAIPVERRKILGIA